jgi:DNA uptake protein ComE-like DNA-binding protein
MGTGRRWTERIKDAFNVHRSEREAWAVVMAAIVLVAGWITYEQWIREPEPPDLSRERAVLDAWREEQARRDGASTDQRELFAFDPNDLSLEDWRRLGLSEKQAMVIHRYEERGGHFRSKADLARMRVVTPELFEQWRPFIQLPDSAPDRSDHEGRDARAARTAAPFDTSTSWGKDRTTRAPLELNSADSVQLVALPGVGPSFARGIIKYRDMLGGYRSLDQLAEVYVLQDKPDAATRLRTLFVVDTLMVRRIAINSCTAEELAAHPYARWKVARPLIAYREQHGPFRSIEAIKGCAVVTAEVYARLAPYLTLEE